MHYEESTYQLAANFVTEAWQSANCRVGFAVIWQPFAQVCYLHGLKAKMMQVHCMAPQQHPCSTCLLCTCGWERYYR